jgi:hypothetical protein
LSKSGFSSMMVHLEAYIRGYQGHSLYMKIILPALVVHTCNPNYSGGRSGGSRFEASLGK